MERLRTKLKGENKRKGGERRKTESVNSSRRKRSRVIMISDKELCKWSRTSIRSLLRNRRNISRQ